MTDLRDFEADLRTMMVQTAERTPVPDGLAERLIAGATAPTRDRHRVPLTAPRRWLPPLLAAAAVIIVVAGSAAVITAVRSERHAPPAVVPSPSHPVTTPVPTPTSPSPSATHRATHPAAGPKVVGPVGSAVPAGFTVVNAQFVDPNLGWALGNGQCTAGLCTTLLRTKDAGRHWVAVPVPPGLTPVDDAGSHSQTGGSCGSNGTIFGPCVDQVAFADALHGYLWSFHSMFMTADGGATWVAQNLGAAGRGATDLVIAAGQVLALTPVQGCSTGCAGQLQRSAIGSSTWQPVQAGAVPPGLSASGLTTARGVAYFLSTPVKFAAGPRRLYRSTDGGASWTAVHTDPCASQSAGAWVTPAPDGSVVLACRSPEGNSSVRVSTDGGATFGPAHPAPGFTVVAASATSLACLVQNGTGAAYTVSHSTDGGITWHPVSTVNAPASHEFVSPSTGYLNGRASTTILITTDGGQSWSSHAFG
jgi:photosystem II stability/assembly factor-like uncharacterized protein